MQCTKYCTMHIHLANASIIVYAPHEHVEILLITASVGNKKETLSSVAGLSKENYFIPSTPF